MSETLDRRVKYTEEAKRMTDRDLREFTFVELRDLSHHVRVEVNGKVKKMWSTYRWGALTFKILLSLGALVTAVMAVSKIL